MPPLKTLGNFKLLVILCRHFRMDKVDMVDLVDNVGVLKNVAILAMVNMQEMALNRLDLM